ncbi:MAG: hypothetical protein U5R46_09570 [Gammaproteobacteria bacterium]|nr:hypothetical protein [Gammaproteobacteria bacterium]
MVDNDSVVDADDMQAALRDRLHGMGVPASQIDDALDELTGQLDDLQDQPPAGGAADIEETPDDDSQYLMPPPDVAAVEALLREVRPVSKPFSIQPDPFDIEDPWEPDEEAEWMSFLAAHPEGFDSLDIVDDLLSIARSHPHSNVHWVRHALQEPLLRRAEAIVRHALSEAPEAHLAWPHTENRPALRSLARLVSHGLEQGDDDEAVALAEWLLRLNPSDNHGFRTLVADARLRAGDDEGVVALADQFPEDMFPELAFGRVLALYRLQRLEDARQALGDAKRRLPKVLRALTAKRLARPKMNPPGITLGGDDQAWLYREEMRDVWLATPGAVEWLKAAAKEC